MRGVLIKASDHGGDAHSPTPRYFLRAWEESNRPVERLGATGDRSWGELNSFIREVPARKAYKIGV